MRRILSIVSLLLFLAGAAAAQNAWGPGRIDLPLIAGQYHEAGTVTIHNNNGGLLIDVQMDNGWQMIELHVHAGWEGNPIPVTRKGNVIPGKFDFKYEFDPPALGQAVYLDFVEDLQGFRWGEPCEPQRTRFIAVHAEVRGFDPRTGQTLAEGAWAHGDLEFTQGGWARWLKYEMAHKRNFHFVDSPVAGLIVASPTEYVYTDESGAAPYFPGESASFYLGWQHLGMTLLDHKVSPLDLFPVSDIDDPRVINMAVLLQSLDADADPQPGILITEEVEDCFDQAVGSLGYISITDWSDDPANPTSQVNLLVDATIANCNGIVPLTKVSPEDAQANLDRSLNSAMFRKNISRTPELASSKAKLNVMGVWFPALRANGDPATYTDDNGAEQPGIPYYDEDGTFVRAASEAKPLVITFTDADILTDAHDVWARTSRDDGNTWKKKNLSRMAYRSSFTLANGYEYFGHCKKPVFQVKGNKILVAWTTKFARGGRPGYAINLCDDPDTVDVETPDSGCAVYCTGNLLDGTQVCEPDYPFDDAYWKDDIWGVSGPQRSVDYTDQGYPEVGEVPYSAVWVARGLILTASDLTKAPFNTVSPETGALYGVGDIVWYKPERLTSARRDANQVFMGGAVGAGFAIAWQEDPGGLRPGEAKGPGPGWGGATTNHKTDIWYSYITWADFAKVDTNFVSGGDPEHEDPDFLGRPKALVPMSLPIRLSDNDVVNTDNMFIELDADGLPEVDGDAKFIPVINPDTNSEDSDGSHRYGYMVEDLWNWDGSVYKESDGAATWESGSGGTLYEFTNQQDELKTVVITADGRPLDGNTGASRANLFLQTYTKPDGTKSAWAIMAYEETKGVGLGPPEDTGTGGEPQDGSGYDPLETFPDEGKNAIYHSFDFQNPDLVSAGTILNLPETDDLTGDPIYVLEVPCFGSDENGLCIVNPDAGEQILDWRGQPILAYENARRPRFILQSKAAAFGGALVDGSFKEPGNSGTVLIVLYKEGEEGAGRQSDIIARRCVVKDPAGVIRGGNPWSPNNFLPHAVGDLRQGERGVQNVSTVTPLVTWINPDRDPEAKGDGTKVCTWEQPETNLWAKSKVNPYEDARAHRGGIRGDFVVMGYSFTPNWAASRNAHDKYDFYIRRSFDGGQTWTTDPEATIDVEHTDIFINPEGVSGFELNEMGDDISETTKHYEVVSFYEGGGVYEKARNVSLTKNNKTSVIEPRIVAVPGTIKINGVWTGIAEDKQNRNVFYVAYGTSTNLPDVDKAPEDLFYSFSTDKGTTLFEDVWVVNPDSSGNWPGVEVTGWGRLAKSEAEDGEVQLRMTPDGSRFYSCWLEEGEEGSDILFRRIMSKEFEVNNVLP